MSLMSMFPGGGGTNNQPLKAPTNLYAIMNTPSSIQITWTDPENEYSQPSGALIGEWMFTRLVRKIGSAPVNANDGELIVESAVKNQYQTTPYIDSSNIALGTTYYYAVFAFTKTRVSSPGAIFEITAAYYDPVLNNNSWTAIHQAFVDGVAQDLWSKGDTKIDNGISYTLQLFNPAVFPLSDGSGATPYAMFVTTSTAGTSKYSKASWGKDEGVDSYTKSILKTVIDSRYSSMSAELRSFIVPVDIRLYKATGWSGITENTTLAVETISSVNTFPLTRLKVGSILPTAASRMKGDEWYLGDIGDEYEYNSNIHVGILTAKNVNSSGNFQGGPVVATDFAIRQEYVEGVVYGFCFGKVGG